MSKQVEKVADDFYEFVSHANTRLPRRLSFRRIADLAAHAHGLYGGSSIHPHFGDLKGQSLFAVSLFPERTAMIQGREIPFGLLAAFYRQNADLFEDPRVILGTWYDADSDLTYLDVTIIIPERQEAILLAKAYNQIAIYDLAQESEIPIGGTGQELPEMPQERQRLPPLGRKQE